MPHKNFDELLRQLLSEGRASLDKEKGVVKVNFADTLSLIKTHGEDLSVKEDGTVLFHKPPETDNRKPRQKRYLLNRYDGSKIPLDDEEDNIPIATQEQVFVEVCIELSDKEKTMLQKIQNEPWASECLYFRKDVRAQAYKHPTYECTICLILDDESNMVQEINPYAYSTFKGYGSERYELVESKTWEDIYNEKIKNKSPRTHFRTFDVEPVSRTDTQPDNNIKSNSKRVAVNFQNYQDLYIKYFSGEAEEDEAKAIIDIGFEIVIDSVMFGELVFRNSDKIFFDSNIFEKVAREKLQDASNAIEACKLADIINELFKKKHNTPLNLFYSFGKKGYERKTQIREGLIIERCFCLHSTCLGWLVPDTKSEIFKLTLREKEKASEILFCD